MIREYFENLQRELLDEKIRLEKQYIEKENRVKEINKFIELLEEKNDPNFESFTPREINIRNKDKIKTLQKEKKDIEKEQLINNQRQKDNVSNWDKLAEIISFVKEEEQRKNNEQEIIEYNKKQSIKVLDYVSREKENLIEMIQEVVLKDISNLYHKMQLGIQLMDVDVNRSKLELRQLLPDIDQLLKNVENLIDEVYVPTEDEKLEALFLRYINLQVKKYDKKIEYISDGVAKLNINQTNIVYQIVKELIQNMIQEIQTLKLCTIVNDNGLILDIACEFELKEQIDKYVQDLFGNEKISTEIYLLQAKLDYKKINDTQLIIKIVL